MVHNERPGIDRSTWKRRVSTGLIGLGVAVVLWLIGAAVIPRWWAQRVADVVDGRLTVGALYGLFIGAVFTIVPVLVLLLSLRTRGEGRSWKAWAVWLVIAAIAAAPNLITLGIVLGVSNAAHDGDRILSVDGPGFRMWSLIGVIVGVLAVVGVWYLLRSRRGARNDNKRLRDEAHHHDGDDHDVVTHGH